MRAESFVTVVRELSPLLILAGGIALLLHGRTDSGLITGGFALLQATAPRPTKPEEPAHSLTN